MTQAFARFFFENSLLDPFWSAFFAGFVIIAPDGVVRRTDAGAEYLETKEST